MDNQHYRTALQFTLGARAVVFGVAVASVLISALLLVWLPSELAPLEDTGWFTTHVSAPEGSTLDYTDRYTEESERILSRIPELDS